MSKYTIRVKTGTKVSRRNNSTGLIIDGAGTDADVFIILFGTKGNTKEIKLPNKLFTDEFERGDEDRFNLDLPDIGEVRQIRVRSDGRGSSPDWHLESVNVNGNHFPIDRILSRFQGLSTFATGNGPSRQFVQNLLKDTPGSYTVTLMTGGGTRLSAAVPIRVKLWGLDQNTVSEAESENSNVDELDRGWIEIPHRGISTSGVTQMQMTADVGKVEYCAIEIGDAIGNGSLFIDTLKVKNGRTGEESTFIINRTLSVDKGLRLYLNPNGPEPRPTDFEHTPDFNNTPPNIFKWICRSRAERNVLNRFLKEQKDSDTEWGHNYLSPETETGDLRDRLDEGNEVKFDEEEAVIWAALSPRLRDWLGYRNFALNYLDNRMEQYINDLRIRAQSEIDALKDALSLGHLPAVEAGDQGVKNDLDLAKVFSMLSTVASVGALIPDPRIKIGFTLISKTFTLLSTVAANDPTEAVKADLKRRRENEVEFRAAIEDDKNRLSLVSADISFNFYILFQKLEAGRRSMRNVALRSIGILEVFAKAESYLKNEFAVADAEGQQAFINGLPAELAPTEAHLRPMLRPAYDRFIVEKCHLRATEIFLSERTLQSRQPRDWPTSDWLKEINGKVPSDAILVTRTYGNRRLRKWEVRYGNWSCHAWRLLIDPSNNAKRLPADFMSRIKFVYGDSRPIFSLLHPNVRNHKCHKMIDYFAFEAFSRNSVYRINNSGEARLVANNRGLVFSGYLPQSKSLSIRMTAVARNSGNRPNGLNSMPFTLDSLPGRSINISPSRDATLEKHFSVSLFPLFPVNFTWVHIPAENIAYRSWVVEFPDGTKMPDVKSTDTLLM